VSPAPLAARLALLHDPTVAADSAVQAPSRKMGRHIASQGFSQALQRHGGDQPLCLPRRLPSPELRQPCPPWEALFAGDPNLAPLAQERLWGDPRRYSLIGLTHTLSTPGPLRLLPELPQAPLHSWDALICTSRAAQSAVQALFEQAEALWRCRGGLPAQRPQLPVIPLGVEAAAFATICPRRQARARLALPAEAMVVLWTGRLELHCKAHHGATFRALAHAAAACPQRPWVLLMYGTAVMPAIPEALRQAAAALCPAVELRLLDGHDLELGGLARAASDVFLSLVDCLQETFGLTPVEAMAAGLPVVASDWNGYRDTLQHGRTGFLIPTSSYQPGWEDPALLQLARQEQALDRVSARISGQITVDAEQAGAALARLAAAPETAVAMGELGRQRVLRQFDWPVVLAQYAQLLDELAQRRSRALADPSLAPLAQLRPIPPLPQVFAAWPSRAFTASTRLQATAAADAASLEQVLALAMVRLYRSELPPLQLIQAVHAQLRGRGPASLPELQALASPPWPPAEAGRLAEALGWLLKHGFVEPVR
jgi:glycosyltransferase involved in cell wall biosynthesis